MLDMATKDILEKIKNEINHEYGFHENIPRINYGPCGVFAKIFYDTWNHFFKEKVHICFIMSRDRDECDHIVIRLPTGELYDGGIGLHKDEEYTGKFLIEEMNDYDEKTLEKWSYGLNRAYPRYCPNFTRDTVERIVKNNLAMLQLRKPLLREATLLDAPAIAAVYLAARKKFIFFAPLVHSDDDILSWIRETLIPMNQVIIVEVNDTVVGMMALSKSENIGWINQLYLLPNVVGQGMGTLLLENAKSKLGSQIRLYTFQENVEARKFYERNGFKAITFRDGSENEENCPDVLYEWHVGS